MADADPRSQVAPVAPELPRGRAALGHEDALGRAQHVEPLRIDTSAASYIHVAIQNRYVMFSCMEMGPAGPREELQSLVVRFIATSPAGEGLRLVGGVRYRLLDSSCRASIDIDYHWDGDLAAKQGELLGLLRRKVLPEVKRRRGYEGAADLLAGPDADSPSVKTVSLAFFRPDVAGSRIELPVDVTRIQCLDPPIARTAGGTVFLTASDADMVESKVIALLDRVFVQDRDLVDLFLFQDALRPDARARLKKKLKALAISSAELKKRTLRLHDQATVHARGVDRLLREQVDGPAAANLRTAGGGKAICEAVFLLIDKLLGKARR